MQLRMGYGSHRSIIEHCRAVNRFGHRRTNAMVPLPSAALEDLEWWISPEPQQTNGQRLRLPPFDLVIDTDASLSGWGAVANNVSIGKRLGGRGSQATHQCARAQGSLSGNPGIYQECGEPTTPHSPACRQHHCRVICEQAERDTLPFSVCCRIGDLVPRDENWIIVTAIALHIPRVLNPFITCDRGPIASRLFTEGQT